VRTYFSSLALLLLACADPLKDPQRLQEVRALAMRVEVDGAPERATPAVGEGATASWLVAGPEGSAPTRWALQLCSPAPVSGEVPRCGGAPLASSVASSPALEPNLHFVVPEGLGDTSLLIWGVLCPRGEAELHEADSIEARFSCTEGEPLHVVGSVTLERGDGNSNPSLEGFSLDLQGTEWLEPEETLVDCGAREPTLRTKDSPLSLELSLPESSRERAGGTEETLVVSAYATTGLLEPSRLVLEPDAPLQPQHFAWKLDDAPSEVPQWLYLVVDDRRGGVTFLRRRACWR